MVQFVGSDASAVSSEPSFEVNLEELRAALYWLVTHNWCWLEATKGQGHLLLHALGPVLEDVLDKYRRSLQGKTAGVPREVVQTATELTEKHLAGSNLGPADAVPAGFEAAFPGTETHEDGMNPHSDGMNAQEGECHSPLTASHARQELDTSCVVTDTGMDSLEPLQLYILKQ